MHLPNLICRGTESESDSSRPRRRGRHGSSNPSSDFVPIDPQLAGQQVGYALVARGAVIADYMRDRLTLVEAAGGLALVAAPCTRPVAVLQLTGCPGTS